MSRPLSIRLARFSLLRFRGVDFRRGSPEVDPGGPRRMPRCSWLRFRSGGGGRKDVPSPGVLAAVCERFSVVSCRDETSEFGSQCPLFW